MSCSFRCISLAGEKGYSVLGFILLFRFLSGYWFACGGMGVALGVLSWPPIGLACSVALCMEFDDVVVSHGAESERRVRH